MKDSREPNSIDIMAFLLSVFLLFAIIIATQVKPNPPDDGYQIISIKENGSLYIKETKTGTVYLIDRHGKREKIIYYGE